MNYTYYSLAFDDEKEILEVVKQMRKIAGYYGCVTSADLYDLAGKDGTTYLYNKYGWLSVSCFAIVDTERNFDRYLLILPKPLQLS